MTERSNYRLARLAEARAGLEELVRESQVIYVGDVTHVLRFVDDVIDEMHRVDCLSVSDLLRQVDALSDGIKWAKRSAARSEELEAELDEMRARLDAFYALARS